MNSLFAMPCAYAVVKGSKEYPTIEGELTLYEVYGGTVVKIEVSGIPEEIEKQSGGFLGFHIHEGSECSGNRKDSLADTSSHLNLKNTLHPMHTGDLPPLMACDGMAYMEVYTSRFYPEEVIGRTIVIHGMSDDFKTQPSGDAGMKIACGEITNV